MADVRLNGYAAWRRGVSGSGPSSTHLREDVHRGVLDLVDCPHEGRAGGRDFGHHCEDGRRGGQRRRTSWRRETNAQTPIQKKNEHTPRLSADTSPTDASSRADARARRWHQRGACEWDARVPLPNAIRPSPASRRGGPHPTLGGTLARWRSTRGGSADTRAARPRDRGRDGSFASALSMRSDATRRVRRSREAMGVPVS